MIVRDDVLTLNSLMELDDEQCNTAIRQHPQAKELLERIFKGPNYWYKPIVTFKLKGHERGEIKEKGKGVEVIPVTKIQAEKLSEVRNYQPLAEIEQKLFTDFGTQMFISTTPQPERVVARNPSIFSSDRGVSQLSAYDPAFFQSLENKAEDIWVVRVIVPSENREKCLPHAEKVANLVLDGIK